MKKITFVTFCLALVLIMAGCAQRRNSASTGGTAATSNVSGLKAETYDRLKDSSNVLNAIMSAPDDAIPETILADAKCVAVVPSMIKGGFIIGGRHGRGVATCRNQNGAWSSPAFFTVSGGSWGAQIGLEAVDLVMLMNAQGMQNLLKSNVELGADASVAAGPVGRDASAKTDLTFKSQVLTYSRSRGLFAGLTLNGAKIATDEDSMRAFYGRDVDFAQVLSGRVPEPSVANAFLSTVRQNFKEAKNR